MPTIEEKKILVELTGPEAIMFREFMKRYETIAPLLGYMDATGIFDLKNMSIQIDIDKNGVVGHTSITRHFRAQ